MLRRGAAASLAMLCLGAALGSCVVPREELTPDGRIVLKYWEKWTGFEGEAMREIVADYNAQSTEYFVEYIEGGALMDQKLLMAIAGGNPPDVAGFWSDRMVGFVQNGALEPLDNRMAGAGIGEDDYLPRVLDPRIGANGPTRASTRASPGGSRSPPPPWRSSTTASISARPGSTPTSLRARSKSSTRSPSS